MELYDIDERIEQAWEACVDPETGEIYEDKKEELDRLIQKKEYVEALSLKLKNLKAYHKAVKAEKEAFDRKKQSAETQIENLKQYINLILNGEKFKSDKVSIYYSKNTSVNVTDLDVIPDMFKKVTVEPIKTDLKKMLSAGHVIEGAELVENQFIVIR